MSIPRRVLLSAAAVLLPTALTLGMASGASAARTPPFTGNAPGGVTCSSSSQIKFPGGLKLTTGPSSGPIKVLLSSCTATNSAVSITSGKGTGSFSGTAGGCAGLATTANTDATVLSVTVKWKGTYNGGKAHFPNSVITIHGATAGTGGNGDVTFTIPSTDNVNASNGGNVTGSFATGSITQQSTLDTGANQATFTTNCGGKHGIKKLTVTGPITIP